MSVVATFTVSAAQFPLTQVLPDESTGVRVERVLDDGDGVTPVFWISGNPDQIDATVTNLQRLEQVQSLTHIDEVEGKSLFRLTWSPGDGDILSRFASDGDQLLCASGTAKECELVVRFPDETHLDAFRVWCTSHHLPIDGTDIHRIEDGAIDIESEPTGSDVFIALTNGLPVNIVSSH